MQLAKLYLRDICFKKMFHKDIEQHRKIHSLRSHIHTQYMAGTCLISVALYSSTRLKTLYSEKRTHLSF